MEGLTLSRPAPVPARRGAGPLHGAAVVPPARGMPSTVVELAAFSAKLRKSGRSRSISALRPPTRNGEEAEAAQVARDTTIRNMWDVIRETDLPEPAAEQDVDAPGVPLRRGGRVKTRLLGFEHSDGMVEDIDASSQGAVEEVRFPVGWLAIVAGPGRGATLPLRTGVSQIGRNEDQAVRLDYGDTAISREGHAIIAYDDEGRCFYIAHGGKSNLVRLNGKPVLTTEPLKDGDTIRLGETTLRLVALCGEGFSWSVPGTAPAD